VARARCNALPGRSPLLPLSLLSLLLCALLSLSLSCSRVQGADIFYRGSGTFLTVSSPASFGNRRLTMTSAPGVGIALVPLPGEPMMTSRRVLLPHRDELDPSGCSGPLKYNTTEYGESFEGAWVAMSLAVCTVAQLRGGRVVREGLRGVRAVSLS
jgi:hypothetical protein